MPMIMFHQTASLNASAPGVLSTWSAAGSGESRQSATGELRSTATSGAKVQITKSKEIWNYIRIKEIRKDEIPKIYGGITYHPDNILSVYNTHT